MAGCGARRLNPRAARDARGRDWFHGAQEFTRVRSSDPCRIALDAVRNHDPSRGLGCLPRPRAQSRAGSAAPPRHSRRAAAPRPVRRLTPRRARRSLDELGALANTESNVEMLVHAGATAVLLAVVRDPAWSPEHEAARALLLRLLACICGPMADEEAMVPTVVQNLELLVRHREEAGDLVGPEAEASDAVHAVGEQLIPAEVSPPPPSLSLHPPAAGHRGFVPRG